MHLFHYHLVTSELRDVEGRYLVKLGFDLVARYGRIGDEHVAIDPGVPWTTTVLEGPPRTPLALALKSGNFGSDDFFLKAWKTLAPAT